MAVFAESWRIAELRVLLKVVTVGVDPSGSVRSRFVAVRQSIREKGGDPSTRQFDELLE